MIPADQTPGDRIIVVGTSGSGKTTLARALAAALDLPHHELDNLSWGPDWTEVPADILHERVAQAVSGPRWVIDGNYGKVRHLTWPRADTLVFLDYPKHTVMWRLLRRTIKRSATRERLWDSQNIESWRISFTTRDSILRWGWTTYERRKREFPEVLARPEYAHIKAICFTAPRQADRWLTALQEVHTRAGQRPRDVSAAPQLDGEPR
jgi:adenylate kinase family enzyme